MKSLGVLLLIVSLAGCSTVFNNVPGWDDEQRVELYTRLGLGYMNQDRLAVALSSLEEALTIAPQDSPANHAMALLRLRLGEHDNARQSFLTALETDSGNFAARNDYGSFLCEVGEWTEGINQYHQALRDPFNTAAHRTQYGLGVCLLGAGDLLGAQGQLQAALAARPKAPAVLYQSAVVSFHLEKYLSTRAFLERLFSTGQVSAESLLLAVRAEHRLGAEDLAAQYAAQLRAGYPASPQADQLKVLMDNKGNG